MIKAEKDTFISLAFLTVLTASLAGNVYLGRIVRSERLAANVSYTSPHEAKTAQLLDVMNVTQSDGRNSQLLFHSDRPTVIYVFSPTCVWCARNFQNIGALYAQAKDRYSFVGISAGSNSLREYLARHPLPFPAYENVSDADLKRLDFRGTPQTIVVTAEGIVEHNWPGAYTPGGAQDTIQKFFAVHLPGLGPGSATQALTSTSAKREP